MDSLKETLTSLAELWLSQAHLAQEAKKRDFDEAAQEIMFYAGKRYRTVRLASDQSGVDLPQSEEIQSIINYTQAFIDIMTPYVFASVPNRMVGPRAPEVPPELQTLAPWPDPAFPEDQQPPPEDPLLQQLIPQIFATQQQGRKRVMAMCWLLQWWLNFCPKLYNLSREGKMAVREAFGKGRGMVVLEMIDSPVGEIPSSNCYSVDDLLIDPDCQQLRDAGFIMLKRRMQNYRIAELWGEPIENLRGKSKSAMQRSIQLALRDERQGNDIGEYYEVWSLIGMGHKLVNAPEEFEKLEDPFYAALESAGPYCHFAIMEGVDHPLGMEPESLTIAQTPQEFIARIKDKLDWPIKTHENPDNPWPIKPLDFLPHLKDPWASSPLEIGLPLQRFIDRVYDGLLSRCEITGQDILAVSAALEDVVVEAITNVKKGINVLRINEANVGRAISELIGVIKFPEVNADVFVILDKAGAAFRELTGLDPAHFGAIPRSQDRSAEASKMREAGLSRRPDDYADTVETWMSDVSAGEALAARMLVSAETISRLAGEPIQYQTDDKGNVISEIYGPLTELWMTLVHTDKPEVAAAEVAYTVESGSGRRRNKQLLQENIERLFNLLAPVLVPILQQTGDIEPYVGLLQLAAQAYDIPVETIISKLRESLAKLQTNPPVPPEGEELVDPEQQMRAEERGQNMAMQQEEQAQRMMTQQDKHDAEMAAMQQQMQVAMEQHLQKLQLAEQKAREQKRQKNQ